MAGVCRPRISRRWLTARLWCMAAGVLLPVPFPQTNLHVLRAGVFVGSVQKGRFVPEHHLFTAFGAQCANREELTLTDPRCVEYLSGREVEARTACRRLVLRDGGRLAAGRRQGVRRAGEKPLPQGAAAAVNGQKKRIFSAQMLKTGRIRLERSARLC